MIFCKSYTPQVIGRGVTLSSELKSMILCESLTPLTIGRGVTKAGNQNL